MESFSHINKHTISQETLTCLQSIIHKDPSSCCWMINKILSIQSKESPNLENVCFAVLMESFQSILSQNQNSDVHIRIILCLLTTINFSGLKNEFCKHINSYAKQMYTLKSNEIRDIKLALYYGKNAEVFNDWYETMCNLRGRTKSEINIKNAECITKSIFNVNEEGQTILDHEELLLRTVTRKIHWLNDIITICDTLMTNGKDDDLSFILSSPCLQYLTPMLLFGFLTESLEERNDKNSSIYNCFNLVLEKTNFNTSNDPTLRCAYSTFKNHLNIANCILNHQSNEGPKTCIKRVLQLLQSSDVLRVLKLTTDIHNISDEEIKGLLKQCSMPDNIFQAYRSLLNAFKAILLCNCYAKNHLLITEYLTNMQSRLIYLQPLSLKLETIENIFSLLFLRYEDFCQSVNDERLKKEQEEENSHLKYRKKKKKTRNSIFISNKYAVREILYYLTEIIESIESDSEEASKTTTRLKKSLTDANWRLQLLMDSNFIKRIDTTNDDLSCEELTLDDLRSNKIPIKNNLDETEIDSESDFVTDSSLNSNKKLDNSSGQGSFFLNRMLANPESLILQCLWKNDYAKAENVMKVTINFSKQFRIFQMHPIPTH